MKLAEKIPAWSAVFLVTSCFVCFLKFKVLARINGDFPAFYAFLLAAKDLLAFAVISFLFRWFLPRALSFALTLLFFAFIAGTALFHGKTGYPVTWPLVAQLGSIFELQASITAGGNSRMYLLAALLLFAWLGGVLVFARLAKMFPRGLSSAGASVLAAAAFFSVFPVAGLKSHSYSLFVDWKNRLFDIEEIAASPLFRGLSPAPEGEASRAASGVAGTKKKNVILVVHETFNAELVADEEKFARVLPNLHRERGNFAFFHEHHTPWQFSSKSLYSIVCGRYPHPSELVEIRLLPERDCGSWVAKLRGHGFQTWVSYSGDWRYDRMGSFMKAQGFEWRQDRKTLDPEGKHWSNSWGVDDRAAVEALKLWHEKQRPERFAAVLILINSHHPFAVPDEKYRRFESDYENAFHYQDAVLADLIGWLRTRGLFDETLLIVTGDHGTQYATADTSKYAKERFHVPLLVNVAAPRRFRHPTTHADLGGAIIDWLGLKNDEKGEKHHLLFESPRFIFDHQNYIALTTEDIFVLNRPEERVFRLSPKAPAGAAEIPCGADECLPARQFLLNRFWEGHHAFPDF